jgi:hypothetical protein
MSTAPSEAVAVEAVRGWRVWVSPTAATTGDDTVNG